MSFKKEHRQETLIYLLLWAMLFLAPVISLSIRTANTDATFDWDEILTIWKEYIPFFIVFLIHNHLLAPILIYRRKKKWLYFASCLAIIVVFQTYQCNHRPNFIKERPRHEMMAKDHRPPMPPEELGQFDDEPRHKPHPPLIIAQHDIIAIIILILMLGMNLGIKLYFRQRDDQKKMEDLEKQNLEQQLEYLKYQINPHFFMNTLNNIHALVDIDPEKAKATILELSKMMRFVLYEGNKTGVPLDREIAFLKNYITLMKLRYTNKVRITVDIPETIPNKEIPPLIFITFVENAFKHGVSYQQESFIEVTLAINDDKLHFTCRNSRIPREEDKHGGVGLTNIKKRLELIYGSNFTLDIKDQPEAYTVNITIPI